MAAMNRSEMNAGAAPGADLNLDDDSLFAELDSEVLMGDSQAAGGAADFDLDLGGGASEAGGTDDLDLDLGGEPSGAAQVDDLDLDLGGSTEAAAADDLDLDLGGTTEAAAADDLDLDLGGEAAAPEAEIDLDLGGTTEAAAEDDVGGLDLDLGSAEAAPADDMDLDLSPPESEPAETGMDLDLDLGDTPSVEMTSAEPADISAADVGDMDLELEPIGAESPAGMSAVEDTGMDISLEEPAFEAVPAEELAAAPEEDFGMDALSVEPMDLPEEPVFDLEAAPAAPPVAEPVFHAAEDVPLGDEALSLELQDVDMEPIEEEPAAGGVTISLEPAMRTDNGLDLGPMPQAAPAMDAAAEDFVAVPEAALDDEDLLELNLDDLDAPSAQAPMMQAQMPASPRAAALETTLPMTEQLEIPPDVQPMDMPAMEPMAGFDDFAGMGTAEPFAPIADAAAESKPQPALQPMPGPRGAPQPAKAMAHATMPQAPSSRPAAPQTIAGSLLGNDILMAISHQISVQLGSLSLNGKELMDISYGSVLPLDRLIGEPVDLVLENKTIAQAEVVLINGKNLGVRIVALNR